MKQEHQQAIFSLINQYKELNIKAFFAKTYKKQKDISSVLIGEYTVSEITDAANKVFNRLENELNNSAWKYLPLQSNCNNELGNGYLIVDLQNLLSSFNKENINKIPFYLNRLICYQIQNGFWDKKTIPKSTLKEDEINKLKEELQLISAHLQEYSKQSIDIIENLKEEKISIFDDLQKQHNFIEKLIEQKNKELEVIQNNYTASQNKINEINKNHVDAAKTSTKIKGILKNVQEKEELLKDELAEINDEKKEYEKTVNELIENAKNSIKEFENKDKSFKEKLAFVEEKKKYFDEKLKEAEKITGIVAGATMSETFINRKRELEPSVKKWRKNVIFMTIITVLSILAIFTNIFGLMGGFPKNVTTLQLISNSVKTLPFFFLLYYAISQYNKERNFQEEYAFKSSIAVTLNAFADLTTNLKEQFIVDSVTNIYQSPIRYKKIKDKESIDIIDTAKELLLKTAEKTVEKI